MLKSYKTIFISLLLSFVMILCCACGNNQNDKDKDTGSNKTSASANDVYSDDFFDDFFESEDAADDTSSGSNSYTETVLKNEDYTDGDSKVIIDFSKGKDMFGEKSISIIGDSISQGLNARYLYDQSWASQFKNKINQKYGSNNIGFVSLSSYYSSIKLDGSEAISEEIHKVKADDAWQNYNTATKKYEAYKGAPNNYSSGSPYTPGNYSFIAKPLAKGAKIEISVNRKQGGVDRKINGFYIYHSEGSTYGKYQVKVNGTEVKTVDCAASEINHCARSPYIEIPAGCGDDIKIDIIKLDSTFPVRISGISYINKPGDVTVNNYSLSGICLTDYSDDLLKNLCKANVVIFALGTNDSGSFRDLARFKAKLKVVVDTCKENGSTLVVTDFIWSNYPKYKSLLEAAARATGGYYLDFSKYNQKLILNTKVDGVHPTIEGHKFLAGKICDFFSLN